MHLAAARMVAESPGRERGRLLQRLEGLGRDEGSLLDDLLRCVGGSRLDLPARRAAASIASSDHWSHWSRWLRWLEDPLRADYAAAALADDVLRTCAVCSDLRFELIG